MNCERLLEYVSSCAHRKWNSAHGFALSLFSEERDANLLVVYFKNFSPQKILWLWIQYVALPKPSVCLPVRYVLAYIVWTAADGCFAKWNDSKRLLC